MLLFVYGGLAFARAPILTEQEAQNFINEVTQKYNMLEGMVVVKYNHIEYIKGRTPMGEEEVVPTVSGISEREGGVLLAKTSIFMEIQDGEKFCKIVLVKDNYQDLWRGMMEKNEGEKEKILLKAFFVHELAHCIEYQNMIKTGVTGWGKYPTIKDFFRARVDENTHQWQEGFADSFSVAWAEKEGYFWVKNHIEGMRRKNKHDYKHDTARLLSNSADNAGNLCEIAHQMRGGDRIEWSVCANK